MGSAEHAFDSVSGEEVQRTPRFPFVSIFGLADLRAAGETSEFLSPSR